MTRYLLTFEYNEDAETLEVYADAAGLDHLIDQLSGLRSMPAPEHAHFMTDEWGGPGLSSKKQNERAVLLNHVRFQLLGGSESR